MTTEAKRRLTARIVSATEKDWKAAAWILEKLYPKEFGPNAEFELKNQNPGLKIMFDTAGESIRELLTFPILGNNPKEQAELEAEQEKNIAFWESQAQSNLSTK